jgi:inorganic pyrophosphatase
MNLWKDLKPGPSAKVVYAVIEIPKGSRNKYKYDEDKGLFVLDRVLYSPFYYLADYGIIPKTGMDDGNPLDILVIMDEPTFPGCIIKCRPIGMLRMIDGNDRDDKVIGVPINDPKFKDFRDIQDVSLSFLEEIEHFFQEYKRLEGKDTEVLGWSNAKRAFETIEYSIKLYYTALSMKSLFSLNEI